MSSEAAPSQCVSANSKSSRARLAGLRILALASSDEHRILVSGDLVEDRLKVSVYSQCPRERGPRHTVTAQRQINHPSVEVKPGIGGRKPERRHHMRQSLGRLAAAV